MKAKNISSILGLLLFISGISSAQVEFLGEPAEILSAYGGAQFYSRTLKQDQKEKRIQQWGFPLFATSRWLRDDLHLNVSQTFFMAQLEGNPNLNGLENTQVQAAYRLFENTLTYLGLSLPITGVNSDVKITRTSNLLYTEALQFGVSRIAEGTNLDIGLAYARPMGNLSVGLGAGYVLKGSYERILQTAEPLRYNPGNAFSLSIGGQFRSGPTSLNGNILYHRYEGDSIDKIRFDSRNDLTFLTTAKFRLRPFHLTLFLADTIKDGSVSEEINPFRNRFNASVGLAYSLLNERLFLKTQASLKRFLDDEARINAAVNTFGGGFQLFITDNLACDISADLMSGEMDSGQTDISGYNLGFLAHYGF